MQEDDHEDWAEEHDPKDTQNAEIQRLLSELELRAKTAMNYLILEGFVETTETPGVYKYTPEGLVLARQQYKKMKEEGLL